MRAVERVRHAYRQIAEHDRPEVWITLRDAGEALADAAQVDDRVAAGEHLPLAGLTLGVKDNIDVAGLPTTAGCPAFASTPTETAAAVQRLVDAGMVVIGKTNLDQFATGLGGTRSPYGPVRDARRPQYASGGSSSGSAVAVALGQVDAALGTDTAGSGRVPAAFQGIIGLKPTRGLVPTAGVVPACRSFDCVSVFARTIGLAERLLGEMADPPETATRPHPCNVPLGAPATPTVAVPGADDLRALSSEAAAAFERAAATLVEAGARLVEIDLGPFIEAGNLLYNGAFVAERHAAFGTFAAAHPGALDPTVAHIVGEAAAISASTLVRDTVRLAELSVAAHDALRADVLLVPTTTRQPTIAELRADPIGANNALGRWTRFANLLDLCAVAVPAGEADGGCFGVSVLAPAFADAVIADVTRLLTGEPRRAAAKTGVPLLVVGAHLGGQPLNHQLVERGGRLVGAVSTAPEYRLFRLETDPPKPGLVRVDAGGAPVTGELWQLPAVGLGTLLAQLPAPMTLGRVRLEDGREVTGFLCEPLAVRDALDITAAGSWVAHLAQTAVAG